MKILIMEDPRVIPSIIRLLKLAEDHTGEIMEPVIALCITEADVRLSECKIAIIDFESEWGPSIARRAVNDIGIPVMATTIRTYNETYPMERQNLRFISKSDWEIARFREIILEFIELARQKSDIIVFTA